MHAYVFFASLSPLFHFTSLMNPLNVHCRMFLYANIVYLNMHICHVIHYAIVWCISLGQFLVKWKKEVKKTFFLFLFLSLSPTFICVLPTNTYFSIITFKLKRTQNLFVQSGNREKSKKKNKKEKTDVCNNKLLYTSRRTFYHHTKPLPPPPPPLHACKKKQVKNKVKVQQ